MMGASHVVLNLSLRMKSYGVTIQMKPLKQYFHIVLFVILNISILKIKFENYVEYFLLLLLLGIKRLHPSS